MTRAIRPLRLRAWQRLSVRAVGLLVAVTIVAIGVVGTLVYQHQKRDLQATLGTLLLNIARTGALLVEPALHAEVQRTLSGDSDAYRRVRAALAAIQDENGLETPIYTLTDFDQVSRRARFMVTSRGPGAPGELYPLVPELIEPLSQSFRDNVAAHTGIYHNQSGTWITAFAPIRDGTGRVIAVLDVDYRVNVYVDRLAALRVTVLLASVAGAIGSLLLGVLFAHRLTGSISALTHGALRVAEGDLSQRLKVRSSDEVGQLTQTFNAMLDGLRQRDFIRDTFGRYVSPEVARQILESPGGLRFGGEKRDVTVLMSDLRGYTRFAEIGEPARVVAVLNDYLARMADIIIAHGGTINEFIGDAIFAVFGAPAAHPDHAERAAGAALAMQRAMTGINAAHERGDLPRFEMGIGINTGEAVLGNIGSEQRAKYAVLGNAVNVAGRVEGCTVGGQIFISAATLERIRHIAEVGSPIPVEVKGLAGALLLYELRGLAGRFAGRLPDVESGADPQVDVTLPLLASIIDGKIVSSKRVSGVVLRLGTRQLDVRLDEPVAPLTNVRLRLTYPGLGYDSGDLYGKVVGDDSRSGSRLTRIRLTSVEPVDQTILEGFLDDVTSS
ncbi:MAG TPA: adenylate/guanylate cyclase domain-containing protein [Methylomirabilota bacterium]|nr:adenylate/guanylate cyclase domain-containing protein [Methylomirabilota bacterium]